MGIETPIDVEETADGPRINLVRRAGRDSRASPRRAAQGAAARGGHGVRPRVCEDGRRVFVDALAYRKGKDLELRQMAKFLAEKVKQTGQDQQLGPLNPYERRIVHLAVAEVPGVTTESIGDAFSKTVHLSLRK